MEQSDLLALPYIAASQDQKHITHNEALLKLDALLHLSVKSRALSSPPDDPETSSRYMVAGSATGLWDGHDGEIAAFQEGAWEFFVPQTGWRLWVEDEATLLALYEGSWRAVTDDIRNAKHVGINATADETNRLSVNAAASLFNHEGAGHQLKINKAGTSETASLLFQSNWSGRAEMGLAGEDAFKIKVSADGGSWRDSLSAEPATGIASMPQGANSGTATLADDSVVSLDMGTASGLFMLWCADETTPDASDGRYAFFYFDCSSLPAVVDLQKDSSVVVETGSTPNGTSGVDGHLTIRVNNGAIHVENRRGSAHRYRWMLFA